MIRRCLDRPAQTGRESVEHLRTAVDRGRDLCGPQLEVWADGRDPELFTLFVRGDDLIQPPARTRVSVVDESPSALAFAHRRPRGDHDQVARLEAAGLVVEIAEARWRPGDVRGTAGEGLELVDLVVEDLADLPEVDGTLLVGDLEEEALGLLDHLRGLAVALGHRGLDLLRRRVEAAHQRVLLDDLRVVPGAARRRHLGRQAGDHIPAADLLQLAVLGEGLGDGQDVDGVGVLVEADDCLVDRAVAVAIEVLGVEADVEQHRLDRRLRDHHRPEHRFLGLKVLRRDDGFSVGRQLLLSRAGNRPARGPSL